MELLLRIEANALACMTLKCTERIEEGFPLFYENVSFALAEAKERGSLPAAEDDGKREKWLFRFTVFIHAKRVSHR
jgi:hypothetical protein